MRQHKEYQSLLTKILAKINQPNINRSDVVQTFKEKTRELYDYVDFLPYVFTVVRYATNT